MPVTMQQIRAALDPEEPDYDQAAELGPDALPHLETLITGTDISLAAKAASLAGMIPGDSSAAVITRAAQSGDARVRVAAAAACRQMDDLSASQVLCNLVTDNDVGVQKVALQSVPVAATTDLRAAVQSLSSLDASFSEPAFTGLVSEALERMRSQGPEFGGEEALSAPAEGETSMPAGEMEGESPDSSDDMPSNMDMEQDDIEGQSDLGEMPGSAM